MRIRPSSRPAGDLELFDARRVGAVGHGGTFNGSSVAAAVGLATLRELEPGSYARLDAMGDRLRERVQAHIEGEGLDARIDVVGSLLQIGSGDSLSAVATGAGTPSDLFLGLLLEGFYLAPRGMGAIPAIATDADIDDLADAIGHVLTANQRVLEPARA